MLTTKNKLLIGLLTIIICAGLLIGAWLYLPGKYFVVFLIGSILLLMIIEPIATMYDQKKINKEKETWSMSDKK